MALLGGLNEFIQVLEQYLVPSEWYVFANTYSPPKIVCGFEMFPKAEVINFEWRFRTD